MKCMWTHLMGIEELTGTKRRSSEHSQVVFVIKERRGRIVQVGACSCSLYFLSGPDIYEIRYYAMRSRLQVIMEELFLHYFMRIKPI